MNAPTLSWIAASSALLECLGDADVDLAVNGDAGRVAQPGVIHLELMERCGHARP